MESRFKLIGCLSVLLSLVVLPVVLGCSCDNCTVGQDYLLKEYYVDLEPWDGVFDDDGIPLVDYGGNLSIRYDPATVSQHALAEFDLYLESCDGVYKEDFLKQAEWLLENLVMGEGRGFYVWEYSFDYATACVDVYMKAPWVSAVAQGQGISVLLRAYELTGDKEYLEAAEAALEAFEKTIDEGGVAYTDGEGFSWYEQYPGVQPSHVLNGFIYALFGLNDMYQATGSERALGLFNDGVETLKANLQEYDTGLWSTCYLPGGWGSCRFAFILKTDNNHPSDRHPIDEIRVVGLQQGVEEVAVSLDVGHQDDSTDITSNNSYLCYDPLYYDISRSYVLDGRTVRNYEDYGSLYELVFFALRFSVDPYADYYLEVSYKDISDELVHIESILISDLPYDKRYFKLGDLPANSSGEWKTCRIEIPQNVVSLGCAATVSDHRLHIEQLEALHEITGEDIFSEYALKFRDYLNRTLQEGLL